MPKSTTAVVYARLSVAQGEDEQSDSITDQLDDARELAKRKHWTIVDEIIEDGKSAFNGTRSGYQQLVEGLQTGRWNVVIARDSDRLYRRTRDLEQIVDAIEAHKTHIETLRSGIIDLTTADGRSMARILCAMSQRESEKTSERVKRSHRRRAEKGQWTGGPRPMGYHVASKLDSATDEQLEQGLVINAAEAPNVRELAERFARGDSIRSMMLWADKQQIVGTRGKPLGSRSILRLLTNPLIAGLKSVDGEMIDATWEPLIDRALFDQIIARDATRPSRKNDGAPKKHLLSGILTCSKCGTSMTSGTTRTKGGRSYRCARNYADGAHQRGCGQTSITAEKTEAVVKQAVVTALDTTSLDQMIASHTAEDAHSRSIELLNEIESINSEKNDAADAYAEGAIDITSLKRINARLTERAETAQQELSALSPAAKSLPKEARPSADIAGWWDTADTADKRALIDFIFDEIVVLPAPGRGCRFDADRLDLKWAA